MKKILTLAVVILVSFTISTAVFAAAPGTVDCIKNVILDHSDMVLLNPKAVDVTVTQNSQGVPGVMFSNNLDYAADWLWRERADAWALLNHFDGYPAAALYNAYDGRFQGFVREARSLTGYSGHSFTSLTKVGVVAYPGLVIGDVGMVSHDAPTSKLRGFAPALSQDALVGVSEVKYLNPAKVTIQVGGLTILARRTNPQVTYESEVPPTRVMVVCHEEQSPWQSCSVEFAPQTVTVSGLLSKKIVPTNVYIPEGVTRSCKVISIIDFPGVSVGIKSSVMAHNR